jgi:uncharacterized protein (DUF2126 family)
MAGECCRFETSYTGLLLELRQALEPWHVPGEKVAGSETVRGQPFFGVEPCVAKAAGTFSLSSCTK